MWAAHHGNRELTGAVLCTVRPPEAPTFSIRLPPPPLPPGAPPPEVPPVGALVDLPFLSPRWLQARGVVNDTTVSVWTWAWRGGGVDGAKCVSECVSVCLCMWWWWWWW